LVCKYNFQKVLSKPQLVTNKLKVKRLPPKPSEHRGPSSNSCYLGHVKPLYDDDDDDDDDDTDKSCYRHMPVTV